MGILSGSTLKVQSEFSQAFRTSFLSLAEVVRPWPGLQSYLIGILCRQVNSRLSRALSKTEMYNFHNFVHSVRSTTRDHNSACIAAADRFLEAKRVAQLRNFSSEAHGMEL